MRPALELPAANPLARPFTLEPGQVKAFREASPRFAEAKISCLLCLP